LAFRLARTRFQPKPLHTHAAGSVQIRLVAAREVASAMAAAMTDEQAAEVA
jgi:hypothetical protein